jgi:hypothetical protein
LLCLALSFPFPLHFAVSSDCLCAHDPELTGLGLQVTGSGTPQLFWCAPICPSQLVLKQILYLPLNCRQAFQSQLFLVGGVGFELIHVCKAGTWATPPVHFALVILEMGSCELFACASLNTSVLSLSSR